MCVGGVPRVPPQHGGRGGETSGHPGRAPQQLPLVGCAPSRLPFPCNKTPLALCVCELCLPRKLTLMKEALQLPKAAMAKQSVVTRYGGG